MVNSQKGISTIVVIVIVALVILAGIAGYYVVSNTSQTPTPTPNQPAPDIQEASPTISDENAQVIEVSGENFRFDPETITVKKDQPVKIVFTANDVMHDWVVDEFNARTEVVSAGNTTEVTFIPTETGEFEYYCSVGNHRQQGMVGTLIVEE